VSIQAPALPAAPAAAPTPAGAAVGPAAPLEQVQVLTLLTLLLFVSDHWHTRVPVALLAVAALLHRPLCARPLLWYLAGAFVLAGVWVDWAAADNHQYLIGYWCLAMSLAAAGDAPEWSAARSARWLVALCFGFAALWKMLSPDFLDGSFFHHALLNDRRFAGVAALLAGITPEQAEANRAAVAALTSPDATLQAVRLMDTPATWTIARALTAWTVAVELVIALAFLLPRPRRLSAARDVALMTFVATTYAVAPVVGFGWMLLLMGYAAAEPERARTRAAYLALFVCLQLYLLPWGRLLAWLAEAR
jgi:hypothetical protein